MSDEASSGKVLALSDAESEDDHEDATGHITVKDMAAELPATEQHEVLQFNEKRRAEVKKTFDFACENGKLEIKQVRARVPQQAQREQAYNVDAPCPRLGQLTLPPRRSQTYKIMFTKDERAEYGFDAFEEDLFATCPHCMEDDKMAWPDVIKFLDDNL
eukprot:scaffold19468_cov129-Isochrysis_galbana.AAC.1